MEVYNYAYPSDLFYYIHKLPQNEKIWPKGSFRYADAEIWVNIKLKITKPSWQNVDLTLLNTQSNMQ